MGNQSEKSKTITMKIDMQNKGENVVTYLLSNDGHFDSGIATGITNTNDDNVLVFVALGSLDRMCVSDIPLELLLALECGHRNCAVMTSANHNTIEDFVDNLGWIIDVFGLHTPATSLLKVRVLGDG